MKKINVNGNVYHLGSILQGDGCYSGYTRVQRSEQVCCVTTNDLIDYICRELHIDFPHNGYEGLTDEQTKQIVDDIFDKGTPTEIEIEV